MLNSTGDIHSPRPIPRAWSWSTKSGVPSPSLSGKRTGSKRQSPDSPPGPPCHWSSSMRVAPHAAHRPAPALGHDEGASSGPVVGPHDLALDVEEARGRRHRPVVVAPVGAAVVRLHLGGGCPPGGAGELVEGVEADP